MKTIFLLIKDLFNGLFDFLNEYNLFLVRFNFLFFSYIIAFVLITVIWYIYELLTMGHLNQNEADTIIALKWSFVLMLPIADILNRKTNQIS